MHIKSIKNKQPTFTQIFYTHKKHKKHKTHKNRLLVTYFMQVENIKAQNATSFVDAFNKKQKKMFFIQLFYTPKKT